MSNDFIEIDVAGWVERAKADPASYGQRQAAEITLNAIAMTAPLNEKLVLKGGILMGLAYNSPRQTADIDLSAVLEAKENVDEVIRGLLDSAFPRAAAKLGYVDLILQVHSVRRQPNHIEIEDAQFPALKLKVAFAQRGTRQEQAMLAGRAPGIIDLDISFNEPLRQIQVLELTGGQELLAYGIVDLIAEKYRAMLQQVERNRNRRQDVYDLDRLITEHELPAEVRAQILEVFHEKCRSRHIEPAASSLQNPEIKTRSGANWQTLELELGEVPPFEECFERVRIFYESLPWQA
ncbi:putative nucleotidyltransferase component of viral defense system [Parvibaculum indicum]|uniref:nucleotidyl transferase AbiEii/AbiGii toxin family protein n=1 Tax=Parvibaculum indicum TaxID=562969 RepID=UPI0014221014|nr:nucleotidyl transferase AbiEii/AbiGii toxin family protein [Parvibaculum indicum]NIJ43503.1 putative nucleotidyltransferase component of viral defense system [Parvibaculum indicum]